MEGVLQHISGGFELQTKSLGPLNLQHNPLYDTDLSLWFWQVPSDWSQDEKELEYFQKIALGQPYGLPPLIPILVRNVDEEDTEYFIKSGEEFYISYWMYPQLVHVDKPSGLHEIPSVLGRGSGKELETTKVNRLPEYGGPDIVADDNFPVGWSNKIDKTVSCGGELSHKLEIWDPHLVTFYSSVMTVGLTPQSI